MIMDGLYHNQISQWFTAAVVSFQSGELGVSNHITEILGEKPKEDWVELTLFSIESASKNIIEAKMEHDYELSCCIPLRSNPFKLTRRVPKSISEVKKELSIEPPSLYLEQKSINLYYRPVEEYVCPIQFTFLDDVHFYSFYCEHNYIDQGEFSRGIFIRFFPEGIIKFLRR